MTVQKSIAELWTVISNQMIKNQLLHTRYDLISDRKNDEGGGYMIPIGRDEILSRLAGSRQCYKLFINYILRLRVKSFIPARRDPSFVLPGSRFTGTKFSHVNASTRLREGKMLIKGLFKWRWAGSVRRASSPRWDLTFLKETLIKI